MFIMEKLRNINQSRENKCINSLLRNNFIFSLYLCILCVISKNKYYFEASGRISLWERITFVQENSMMDWPGMKEDTQGLSLVNITVLTNTVSSFLLWVPWQS